jgi:hypothetical protein
VSDLADRYGSSVGRRRWVVGGLGAAVGLVVLAVVLWSFVDHASPQVQSGLIRYDVSSPHEATADIQVERSSGDVAASCRVRAVAADHSVVGETLERVESGPTTQVLRVTLRIERPAVSVVTDGCTTPAQSRPR